MQCRNTSRAMASTPFGACSRNAFLRPSILTTEPGCANSFSPPSCSTSFYRERELSLPKFPLVVLIPAADGHPVECLQPQQPTDPAAAEVRLEVAVQCLERKHVPRRESHTIVRHREADHRLRWRTSGTGPPEVELRLGSRWTLTSIRPGPTMPSGRASIAWIPLTIASWRGKRAWLFGKLVFRTRPAKDVVSATTPPLLPRPWQPVFERRHSPAIEHRSEAPRSGSR